MGLTDSNLGKSLFFFTENKKKEVATDPKILLSQNTFIFYLFIFFEFDVDQNVLCNFPLLVDRVGILFFLHLLIFILINNITDFHTIRHNV